MVTQNHNYGKDQNPVYKSGCNDDRSDGLKMRAPRFAFAVKRT